MSRASSQVSLIWLFAAACLGILLVQVANEFAAPFVWDDAYMFVRYADRLLASGVPAFNPGDAGTYGLTSIAYLSVIVPARFVFSNAPALAALCSSLACGLVFLALLARLMGDAAGPSAMRRAAAMALAAFTCAYMAPALAAHVTSGMDTMFALAYVTLWILATRWHERRGTVQSALTLGCFSGAAFSVRPDLLVLTVGTPLAMAVFASRPGQRALVLRVAGVAVAVAAVQSAFYAWWLHSPLPLAFYVKSLHFYGPTIRARYAGIGMSQLHWFVRGVAGLLVVIVAACAVHPVRWWRHFGALEKALLVSAIAFAGYYATQVVQIMYFGQRFYFPLLPVLAYLAARSLAPLAERFPQPAWRSLAAVAVALLLACVPLRRIVAHEIDAVRLAKPVTAERFSTAAAYQSHWSLYWFALQDVSRLPDDVSMATTEVGIPVALNPRRRIVDLAGLNETSMVHAHVSADSVLRREQPDLVYMPHPDYAEMIAAMLADPWFTEHYQVWPPGELHTVMGVAVRIGSPHEADLRVIIERALARAAADSLPPAGSAR